MTKRDPKRERRENISMSITVRKGNSVGTGRAHQLHLKDYN